MTENSLGRLWLKEHPNKKLQSEWKFFLDNEEQDKAEEDTLLESIRYETLKPEDILVIDPCQGSGHILAYVFDVLVQIYESFGYTAREAAVHIVQRNIWGLDIDERATQLAYFSVMMKARKYDRRFFYHGIQPHVYSIQESNKIDPICTDYFVNGRQDLKSAIRNYFINDFYADHIKVYQKRPIYWLFDSGKKNGFKCLIYIHRYQPDTIARIRTDYVHEQQSRYRTAIADMEQRINGASTSERVRLSKQLASLQEQAEEIRVYEEKIHHLADQMIEIDLDDGVKHNYEIFKDVLAKIK